jgi:RecJ-like exonuclease
MNEKELKTLSVAGSIISLIALYMFVLYAVPVHVDICDISLEHAGKIINVTGTVKDFRMNEGNAFFTLVEDGCEIRVVMWENIISGMELRGTEISMLQDNVSVSLSGEVDVHSGYLQIVPTRPTIKMIS